MEDLKGRKNLEQGGLLNGVPSERRLLRQYSNGSVNGELVSFQRVSWGGGRGRVRSLHVLQAQTSEKGLHTASPIKILSRFSEEQ